MTEALGEILKFAKESMKVKTVFAHISVDSIASARTVQKVGFQKTNKQYYEAFHGDKYLHDVYRMEVVTSEPHSVSK